MTSWPSYGRGLRAAALLCTALLAVGCAATPPRASAPVPSAQPSPAADPLAASLVERALGLLGTPYRYGGATPEGMDCSGLVSHVHRAVGIATPRTAEEQQRAAERVELDALRPGDLVFFRLPDPHVGIYVGDGRFVHAPGAGRKVSVARLDEPYFLLGFSGGGRFRP